jgi:hypothetical protein
MTSSAGTAWSTRTSAADNDWSSICFSEEKGLFCAVANTGTGNRVMTSQDAITWTTRTSAADNGWNSVCWSPEKGLFCAVADSGTGNRVMTSQDAITWTTRTSAADNGWNGVCWASGLGLFCAVADSGTGNRVMTSSDSITWTTRTSAADNGWRDVTYSEELGLLIAVSETGTVNSIMGSSDGITWSTRTTPDNDYQSVIWCPSFKTFLAVGDVSAASDDTIIYSSDGSSWTTLSTSDNNLTGVAWSPKLNRFAAIGNSVASANDPMYSTIPTVQTVSIGSRGKGVTTLEGTNLNLGKGSNKVVIGEYSSFVDIGSKDTDVDIQGSTNVSGPFAVTKNANIGTGDISTVQSDNNTWVTQTGSTTNTWNNICWSPELSIFCASSWTGNTDSIMTSPDGITWTTRTLTSIFWNSICWSPELSLFCVVAITGTGNRAATSPDGITWTTRTSAADNDWNDVCWSSEEAIFCAVADSGTGTRVMTSSDGITWITRASAADTNWESIIWSPELSLFCAVSNSGTGNRVMTSPDAITWTTRTSAADNGWYALTWSPELSLFCAVSITGTGDRVMTSPDGVTWTTRTTPDESWRSIVWAPELSLFCASCLDDIVMTSPDGITWTSKTTTSAGDTRYWGITWSPELGIFCAVSDVGTNTVMTSVSDKSSFSEVLNIGTQYTSDVIVKGGKLDIGESSYQTNLGKYASVNGYDYQKCGLVCKHNEQQDNLAAAYDTIEFEFNTPNHTAFSFGVDPPTIPANDGVIQINRRGVYHITSSFTALDSTFIDQSHMSIRVRSGGVTYSYFRIRASGTKSQSVCTQASVFFDDGDTFTIEGRSEAGTVDINNTADLPGTLSVVLVSDLGGHIPG